MNLRDLNRAEWNKIPFTILLCGGTGDGQRITWGHLPQRWQYPVPVDTVTILTAVDLTEMIYPAGPGVVEYAWTDQVTDDGEHIYVMRDE